MTPLQITAILHGGIMLPDGHLAIDSLLAAVVARRAELPPPATAEDCVPIEIPVVRAPGGRFHLASFGVCAAEARELRYVNRRAPVEQYQTIGSEKIKRVQITAGPNKSYRIPQSMMMLRDDAIRWWCIGDAEEIRDLLLDVTHLGRRRGVGAGKVARWLVEPCEPWHDGFPVVRDGRALRALPPDWPGLEAPALAHTTLTYPYWNHAAEELCAVPAVA